MNYFDVLVFIILTYGLLSGFFKGFVVEIAGVIALILGLLGSFKFSNVLGNTIENLIDWDSKTIQIVSFIFLFILIIYSISLLAKMITKTLKLIALGWLNRILGGFFGFLKWAVVLSAFTLIISELNEIITIFSDFNFEDSKSYFFLNKLGNFLFDWVSQSKSIPGTRNYLENSLFKYLIDAFSIHPSEPFAILIFFQFSSISKTSTLVPS